MSSAALITNSQKAFADESDGYTYCYAGLSWSEYWSGENVYNNKDTSSSAATDSHGETDKGGYDAVSRATTNHGLHRGSYQCNAIVHTTDSTGAARDFYLASWNSNKEFLTTDGTRVAWSTDRNTKTTTCTVNGESYTFKNYEVIGTKYVPVKVKTSDYDAFKADRAKKHLDVTENGQTLAGGYSEGVLSSYTATADVNKNTHGLKTASLNSDGDFSFSASDESLTGSGIKDQSIKSESTISDDSSKNLYTILGSTDKSTSVTVGSYGEFLRVDIDGSYGDLGSKMQSVTWTYYGDDATGTKPLRTFGTKFAADNWMHKSNHIQLGLTESARCQLPENTDGTGYWKLTVHALGYKDVETDLIKVGYQNLANAEEASDEAVSSLKSLISKAESLKQSDYTAASWANLQTELSETKDLVAKAETGVLYQAEAAEQIEHLQNAIGGLKEEAQAIVVPTAKKLTYNGKSQTAIAAGAGYTVSKGSATNAGNYKATLSLKDGYKWADGTTSPKTVSYSIAKASNTLKASSATKTVKKSKVKKKAQKVSGAVKATSAQGAVTYAKKSGDKKLSIAKNGTVTVKKGTKKGTHKIKVAVTAAGNGNYQAATKTVTVSVKVK